MAVENKTSGVGFAPGTRIGKYEVVHRIAMGGQAVVYKCHDPLLDRYVAIKQISGHLAEDGRFLDRFRREAQILAKLGSEQGAIVSIYELIEEERGLFIVMEFVPGFTLEQSLSDHPGPVDPKAVLAILWSLASGLNAVHKAGIIHRDIKPSNIIIGEGLKPKIADFGVAASSSGQTSMVLGTTKYMAPEVFEGKSPDARMDMYALGFIAYEMLLGRTKFNEVFDDVVRDRHSEAQRWMKWHGSPSVSAPPLNQVNPAVPQALADIVACMMCKDPDNRFSSMEELGKAIKSSFSRTAKAAAAAAVSRPPARHRPSHAAAPVGAAPALTMADELKPLDGDLGGPAPQDPLPTAALPRKKMSLQAKLIAGGVAAAVLLLVVGGIWIWGKVQQRDATELVSRIYRAAQENYQKGEFADAAKGFESVLKNPHRVPGTSESSVLVHMAKANVAVETAMKGGSPQEKKVHWDEAASFESSARKQLENVQATAPELYNWTRQIKDDLDKFARYRTSSKTFDDGMTAAAALLAEGKYQSARDVLTAKLSVPDLTLTDAQARRAADLRSAITVAEVKSAVERRFKNVPELMNANDWPAVKAELDEIDKQLKENAERLPGADYRAFSERLADLNVKLSGEQKRGQLAAKAEKCRSEGDIAGELAALEELQKDWPTPELSQRITGVKARQLHEQAKALAKDGKVAEAREAYGRLLQMRPGDKAVQSELDALNTAARRVDLIRDGDASLAAGDLPKALTSFVEANKIQTDNETSEKIRGIRFRMQMAEAGRLRDEKKYREAIAAYEKARADYPTGAAEVDAQLATIARSQQYEGLLAEGDKLFDGRQWGKSREAYQKAQKVSSTDEVKQRIAMTFYGEYVELGRSAYDEKNYSSALGYFRIAQKSVDTPEIKALIAQAEKAMKGQ